MTTVSLILEPADDEDDVKDPGRQKALEAFDEAMTESGVQRFPVMLMQKSMGGGEWLVGEFIIKALPTVTPIATALGGYLVAKVGRKVKVKLGDKEIEAGSVNEVERLLKALKDHL